MPVRWTFFFILATFGAPLFPSLLSSFLSRVSTPHLTFFIHTSAFSLSTRKWSGHDRFFFSPFFGRRWRLRS